MKSWTAEKAHSLRSVEILNPLIHWHPLRSVVFVTGISSCLRPRPLWREQAPPYSSPRVHPSVHVFVPVSLYFPFVVSTPSVAPLPLTHTVQGRTHSGSHVLMTECDWLCEWGIANPNTLTRGCGAPIDHNFELQWLDSKSLWRWQSAIWSNLWFSKWGACCLWLCDRSQIKTTSKKKA